VSLPSRADAVIVGAGCIGASIAYHLAQHGVKALVLEREKIAGNGSTGHCAGGVRQQFTTPVNVALSKISIEAFARMNEELAYEGDLYWPVGYLFCVPDQARWTRFLANAAAQRALGVPVEELTPAEVARRWPLLATDDLAGATFCASDGLADPHGVTAAYLAAAKRLGATFEFETDVTGVKVAEGRVQGVVTNKGDIATPVVVNAAGPFAAEVGKMAGVELPVVPLRRQIFTTQPADWVPANFPMVVDVGTGVYMHRESGGLLLGLADLDEPPSYHTHIDLEFRDKVFLLAFERLPKLEDAAYRAGWGGLYEDTPDHNAILGETPGVRGFWLANGFSGHGFMHAPAVGKVIADLVTGRPPRADVSALAPDRFERAELVAEANVI
jgi:sarcosine oxidase subunit beta